MPTDMVPSNAKPAGSASMGVAEPANDPTTNDDLQTADERIASARATAMANHAVDHPESTGETSTEEEVA
jgi:hypothetical protein